MKPCATVTPASLMRDVEEARLVGGKQSASRMRFLVPLTNNLLFKQTTWLLPNTSHGIWYIGHVQQIDEGDGKIEVSFMTKSKGKTTETCFNWPAQEDVLWMERKNILHVIEPPVTNGKNGRTYRLNKATMGLIEQRHRCYEL